MLNAGESKPGLPAMTVRSETATAGNVRAELDIGRAATLRIWRGGALQYDERLTIFQSKLYDGPYGFDIRADDRGEPFVRVGVLAATHAGRARFPDDLRLEFSFDKDRRRYVASLVPVKIRDPLWSGNVAIREVTRAGRLVITTTYTVEDDEFVRASPVVTVNRRSVAVPIGPLPSELRGPLWGSPTIIDLNGDGEPEIDYALATVGTNCCSEAVTYRYDPMTHRYIQTIQGWGLYRDGPRLSDLDGNGITEFVGTSEDITGQFTGGCCSGPGVIRIGRFGHDRIVWVTREYPALIRADAWNAWRAVVTTAKSQPELQPAETAWYLADKVMLDEGADGWARARRTFSRAQWSRLAPQLLAALQAEGYGTSGIR
jgi:hypothetical protein